MNTARENHSSLDFCRNASSEHMESSTKQRATIIDRGQHRMSSSAFAIAVVMAQVYVVLLATTSGGHDSPLWMLVLRVVVASAFLLCCMEWLFVTPLREKSRKAIEGLVLYRHHTRQLIEYDQMTGIYNRRALEERFDSLFTDAKHSGSDLCVLMVDIDWFKNINDTHGHLSGDAAIQQVASVLKKHVQKPGLVARYGGEEFCLVLPGTSLVNALLCAEGIRNAVETSVFTDGKREYHLTVSIGISALARETRGASDLIRDADEALYVAKQAGRNCVRVKAMYPLRGGDVCSFSMWSAPAHYSKRSVVPQTSEVQVIAMANSAGLFGKKNGDNSRIQVLAGSERSAMNVSEG
jgi:diguanylate cyclase (GGDEF)-like protein